ncbi:hypothetical protein HPB51_016303 [Rhipicephalus microplus]|uniref:Uncharacterized protein n=1 Tax=Rhipicephalus microplus TaxID=6941 RepID=A0A9J6EP83_RHIMP|nr:hypothetical protein HPB51_016303 [Rhipicephalus microplus]
MALANEPSDAISRPGPSRMTYTRRQELENIDFQDSTAKSLSTPNETNGQNVKTDSQNLVDGAWETVLTLRQKKALAKEKKAKCMDFSTTSYHQQVSPAEATRKSKYRPAHKWLLPLPKDDFNIVVRPHQELPVKTLTSLLLADAVIKACNGKISVNAYVATSEGTTEGVTHGLDPHTMLEALKANLRIRTQGVEIPQARMFKNTKTAVIIFIGERTPQYVYYNGGELACYPYKVTTQVCKACDQVGYRSDVCPQPDT